MTAPRRAALGFIAAVLSVPTFHQGMWALLHAAGIMPPAPYPTNPVPLARLTRGAGLRSPFLG